MLIINTKAGQQIEIGDNVLTLSRIRIEEGVCELKLLNEQNQPLRTIKVREKQSMQILPNVILHINGILHGNSTYATLGFSAPRSVRIRGSWIRKQKECRTQLSSLSDKELCTHGEALATTPLERELIARLDSRTK